MQAHGAPRIEVVDAPYPIQPAAECAAAEVHLLKFLRFYISPATGHDMAGDGASTEPHLSTLESWVEEGRAPGTGPWHLAARGPYVNTRCIRDTAAEATRRRPRVLCAHGRELPVRRENLILIDDRRLAKGI